MPIQAIVIRTLLPRSGKGLAGNNATDTVSCANNPGQRSFYTVMIGTEHTDEDGVPECLFPCNPCQYIF